MKAETHRTGLAIMKASIEMFDDNMDSPLWQLLSAGTGGSLCGCRNGDSK